MSDSEEEIYCEVCDCYNAATETSPCCQVPLCDTHAIFYPQCSNTKCYNSGYEMCDICLKINNHIKCSKCFLTFCDECDTQEITNKFRCAC